MRCSACLSAIGRIRAAPFGTASLYSARIAGGGNGPDHSCRCSPIRTGASAGGLLRGGRNCQAQMAAEQQNLAGSLAAARRQPISWAGIPSSRGLCGLWRPMAVIKSSPTASQSLRRARRSATLGGSGLLCGFNDPVKSKMRAIPSQKGLKAARTARVFPLRLRSWAGRLGLRLCSNPCLVLKAIYSLPNSIMGQSWRNIVKRRLGDGNPRADVEGSAKLTQVAVDGRRD